MEECAWSISDGEFGALPGHSRLGWDKNSVQLLLDLVRLSSGNFVVAQDRWRSSSSCLTQLTASELERKFFEFQRALWLSRKPSEPIPKSLQFDADLEEKRRNELEMLSSQPESANERLAELAVENFKIEEELRSFRSLELKYRKIYELYMKYRAMTLSIFRPLNVPPEDASTDVLSGLPDSVVHPRKSCFKIRPRGVYFRVSQPLQPLSGQSRLVRQVEIDLEAMGYLKQNPLRIYSSVTCDIFDEIRECLVIYYRIERLLSRKEQEAHQLKVRCESLMLRRRSLSNVHSLPLKQSDDPQP
jgi:hypothetical protein